MTVQTNIEAAADQEQNSQEQSLPSAGELLGNERQRQGLTEKGVADGLYITMHYVRAIESNCFEKLPGSVFARGYIKSYALLLGMDVGLVLASYNAQVTKELDVQKEKTRIQVRKRKDRNRPWVIASAILFVALFIGLWIVNSSGTEVAPAVVAEPRVNAQPAPKSVLSSVNQSLVAEEGTPVNQGNDLVPILETLESTSEANLPEVSVSEADLVVAQPEESETEEAVAAAVDNSEALIVDSVASFVSEPDTTASSESDQVIYVEALGDDVLLISFSGESWVEISDDSQGQIYRDLLETGDVLEVKGTAPFNVLLGDAPFAELSLNGDTIDMSDDIRIDNSARFTIGIKQ